MEAIQEDVQIQNPMEMAQATPREFISIGLESCSIPKHAFSTLQQLIQAFSEFLGQESNTRGVEMSTKHLNEDQSLFKAQGSVWHQSDCKEGRNPENLRNLDTDTTWKKKSGYHGLRGWHSSHDYTGRVSCFDGS